MVAVLEIVMPTLRNKFPGTWVQAALNLWSIFAVNSSDTTEGIT
jgi:hypothetical protein